MIRIWVPAIPPNSNELKRLHYLQVARSREQVHKLMQSVVQEIREDHAFDGPYDVMELRATFHWTDKRKRDIGNYAESLKAIIDSLIGVVMVDDQLKHLRRITLDAHLGGSRKGIMLEFTPIEEDEDVSGQPESGRGGDGVRVYGQSLF